MTSKRMVLLIALACVAVWCTTRPAHEAPSTQKSPAIAAKSLPATTTLPHDTDAAPEASDVTLSMEQERMLERWTRGGSDWQALTHNEEFSKLHDQTLSGLIHDDAWRLRLKQAASLARKAQDEEASTPENTAVIIEPGKIFARASDALRYARALAAGDREAVEEIYVERMWQIATEQHFNPDATKQGGLEPIPMTDEIREQLRKERR